jgi:SWI/SNF-related matrix-associated actin-dependent regulator 1 of chromatin subfamily A
VECLRVLTSDPTAPLSLVEEALAFVKAELLAVCYEDWGPGNRADGQVSWHRDTTLQVRLSDDLLRLRIALKAIRPPAPVQAAAPAPLPPIPCPEGLAFMPFQIAGAQWALAHSHSLNADEPGLGKTIQAIGVINASDPKHTVIVCPASVRLNWQRELQTWLTKPRTIQIAYSSDMPTADIVIVGYSTVDRRVLSYVEHGIDLLVLDEVHAIKSAATARTRACVALIRAAKQGLYLSGTPMLNRPVELEPLLAAVKSPIAANYQRRYCAARMRDVYIAGGAGQKRRVYDANGASNVEELGERLREEFMIRRAKADVLTELPEKRRRILALDDVAGAEELVARASAALTEIDLDDLVSGKKPSPAAASELALLRHEEALAKLPQAMDYAHELLEDEGVEKLVIFAHHRDVIDGIVNALKDFQPALLYGGMSDAIKQEAVDRFQLKPECRVFVGGIQAAGVGITLTAASRALFVELDWVPAILTQAEDRIHRKGQRGSVLCEYLVVPGGVDDRLAGALHRKQVILDRAGL